MEYSTEIAQAICELIMDGRSMRAICAVDGMPSKSTVFKWLSGNKDFADQYARAREIQAELLADEILEISDDESNDVTGELKMPNSVAVARSRLRTDNRKWIAAKLLPKKYGDKIQTEVTGQDGGPIQASITVEFVKSSE
jgi:hypothetical protein